LKFVTLECNDNLPIFLIFSSSFFTLSHPQLWGPPNSAIFHSAHRPKRIRPAQSVPQLWSI
jgi:hypothetical protein